MTKTKEVRLAINGLLRESRPPISASQRQALAELQEILKSFDPRPFGEVLEMLSAAAPVRQPKAKIDLADTVQSLRTVLMDDARFARAVADLGANRSATKAFLAEVYLALFQRSRGVRATAPREEIIQLILDERNILRRHGTLEALTRLDTVAAE